jgi:hypothetical protein
MPKIGRFRPSNRIVGPSKGSEAMLWLRLEETSDGTAAATRYIHSVTRLKAISCGIGEGRG